MISYEEAKKIVDNELGEKAKYIDTVSETDNAYMFDDSKELHAGFIPLIIRKSDGKIFNCWQYLQANKLTFEDFKAI